VRHWDNAGVTRMVPASERESEQPAHAASEKDDTLRPDEPALDMAPMGAVRRLLSAGADPGRYPRLLPPPVAGNAAVGRLVQRLAAANAAPSPPADLGDRLAARAGGGGQLPEATRQQLEAGVGSSLTGVRVHTDGTAAELADQVQARAFTVGQDIYFGRGEYNPSSASGYHLLAHEVVHTRQQAGPPGGSPPVEIGAADAPAEKEADAIAGDLVQDLPVAPVPPTAGLPVQRWTAPFVTLKSDEELIRDGVAGDVTAAKEISDYAKASEADRFALIHTLLGQGWVGPRDEYALEAIWRSFGQTVSERLADPATFQLFKDCVDRGAELDDLPAVRKLRDQFVRDVSQVASTYLFGNRGVLLQQMQEYGIDPQPGQQPVVNTDEAAAKVRELQEAAQIVADLQGIQEQLRTIRVGVNFQTVNTEAGSVTTEIPVNFDPLEKPQFDNDGPHQPKWADIKQIWDHNTGLIGEVVDRYPVLYGISREGRSADTNAFQAQTDPAAALRQLADALRKLLGDIERTQTMLDGGDLDPRALAPLHRQLWSGYQKPSAVDWSTPFGRWVGDGVVHDYQDEQWWIKLGLDSLSMAAFLIAPFTGGASLLVAAVGVGAAAVQAARAAQQADALGTAQKTSVLTGTALVDDAEVFMAAVEEEEEKIKLAVAVATFGALAIGEIAAGAGAGAGATGRQLTALETAARAEAERIVAAAGEEEGATTRLLQGVADRSGGRLAGLDNRMKTVDSLARKLHDLAEPAVARGQAPEAAVSTAGQRINDALRYTVELDPVKYAEGYQDAVGELEAAGCKLERGSNAWDPANSPFKGTYRGINTTFRSPNGTLFEVQFHTPESFAIKSELHALYEEMRLSTTSAERKAELAEMMRQRWASSETPPGATDITPPTPPRRGR
jgi:hypothetical protein